MAQVTETRETTEEKKTRKRPVDPTRESLSPNDLAALLNVGRTTAYALLKRKAIPSFRIEGLRRVRREDALAYRDRLFAEEAENE